MNVLSLDARARNQRLVVHVQRTGTRSQRVIAQYDVNAAQRHNRPVAARTAPEIAAVDQTRRSRRLNDVRTIQLRPIEITQRRRSDIHRVANDPIPAGIRTKNPGHAARSGTHRLRNLHEHRENHARTPEDVEYVRNPTAIQSYVRPHHTPLAIHDRLLLRYMRRYTRSTGHNEPRLS